MYPLFPQGNSGMVFSLWSPWPDIASTLFRFPSSESSCLIHSLTFSDIFCPLMSCLFRYNHSWCLCHRSGSYDEAACLRWSHHICDNLTHFGPTSHFLYLCLVSQSLPSTACIIVCQEMSISDSAPSLDAVGAALYEHTCLFGYTHKYLVSHSRKWRVDLSTKFLNYN